MRILLALVVGAMLASCTELNVYEKTIYTMDPADGGWRKAAAGNLSGALIWVCSNKRPERRHTLVDDIERQGLLRVNCVGDERYAEERLWPLLGKNGSRSQPHCAGRANIPGTSKWVASVCEVEWD